MSGATTGLQFTNTLGEERSLTNHILLNGSGVAAGDIDGDGWCDVYLCSLEGPNRLFRNLGGWKFQDITTNSGVTGDGLPSTGAIFADVDGDGDLDLLVNSVGGGTRLFLNDGRGHFKDGTGPAGLGSRAGSMSMAMADVDGLGRLDLYVANYSTWTMRDQFSLAFRVINVRGKKQISMVNGRPVTDPDLAGRFTLNEQGMPEENGEADFFFRNDGHGRFTRVPFTGGTFLDEDGRPLAAPLQDWGLSAMFRDLNHDGAPDLYVCNDLQSPDRIWLNSGDGHFRALPRLAVRRTSWYSMGIDFADLNHDGEDEFFVTDMLSRDHRMRQTQNNDHLNLLQPPGVIDNRPQTPRNTLFLNRGDGDYSEIACFSGVAASDWSWGPFFLDVDLDGHEDLLMTTGFERDVNDIDIGNQLEQTRREKRLPDAVALRQRKAFPKLELPNVAFRNRGDLTFEDASDRWGFNLRAVSQGMALADLDNDGDLDVILNNLNGPATLLRNECSEPRIAVRLKGRAPNTRGVGARIRVVGGPTVQSQEMICGGRYLSSDDPMRMFAAGNATQLTIEITWRSGGRSVVQGPPNTIYEIEEPAANGPTAAPAARPGSGVVAMFQDASRLLAHRHVDAPFDDFVRQPLLPRQLSQLGPGVTWFDLDQDGWDDLVVAGGRSGALAAFHNDQHGGFARLTGAPYSAPVPRDQTAVLGDREASGQAMLLVGLSNFEDGGASGASVQSFHPEQKMVMDLLPGQASSVGPLAMADLDGSGERVLFVGGRAVPGRHPEAAASSFHRLRSGQWQRDELSTKAVASAGLVSGAIFSDVNGDGFPDLVLACEWGPVRVFLNDHGRLTEATESLGLAKYSGWWNGVVAADVDGDGRLDIVASNWGRNTKYALHPGQPVRLYYGPWQDQGGMGLIEAQYDPALAKVVPWATLDRVAEVMPALQLRFPTFHEYSTAGMEEILAEQKGKVRELSANWLDSTVFLNRGDHFEARALPDEAQLSPAFGICAGDLDGDGAEDLFLSQNFFGTEARTARYDSGRGLVLRGDGRGGFTALSGAASGVRMYGEGRGAALCDYDGDGRVDLASAQNSGETKLYRNITSRPGLRVRVTGPMGGAGVVLRMVSGGAMGPSREIHAGSGYWSQDSEVQVLHAAKPADKLWMRWPGGRTNLVDLPSGAREITVDRDGRVTMRR